jgi:hypothetical protein
MNRNRFDKSYKEAPGSLLGNKRKTIRDKIHPRVSSGCFEGVSYKSDQVLYHCPGKIKQPPFTEEIIHAIDFDSLFDHVVHTDHVNDHKEAIQQYHIDGANVSFKISNYDERSMYIETISEVSDNIPHSVKYAMEQLYERRILQHIEELDGVDIINISHMHRVKDVVEENANGLSFLTSSSPEKTWKHTTIVAGIIFNNRQEDRPPIKQ